MAANSCYLVGVFVGKIDGLFMHLFLSELSHWSFQTSLQYFNYICWWKKSQAGNFEVDVVVFATSIFACCMKSVKVLILIYNVHSANGDECVAICVYSKVPLKKENGQTIMVPLFQSQENISGKVICLIV